MSYRAAKEMSRQPIEVVCVEHLDGIQGNVLFNKFTPHSWSEEEAMLVDDQTLPAPRPAQNEKRITKSMLPRTCSLLTL